MNALDPEVIRLFLAVLDGDHSRIDSLATLLRGLHRAPTDWQNRTYPDHPSLVTELRVSLTREELPGWPWGWGFFPTLSDLLPRPSPRLGREYHTRQLRELLTAYAGWLEARGDPRGECLRLELFLPERRSTADNTRPPFVERLLGDLVAAPADPTPRLVLADWLEERDDPRAELIRTTTRLRELGALVPPQKLDGLWVAPLSGPFPGYESFTAASRRVMQRANQEAQRLNHPYIGTQHLLLGLLRDDHEAARVLDRAGLTLDRCREAVERLVPQGPDMVLMGKLPQSIRANRSLLHAAREAWSLEDTAILPEHLLLGLCLVEPCVATRVLRQTSAWPIVVCAEVVEQRGGDPIGWVFDHPEVWG